MSDFVLSPVARGDLHEIWDYYATVVQNVDVADLIRDELFRAFDALVEMPKMGHFRSDLTSEPLRFWRVRDYFIIYRSERTPLEIVRVLHGKRDVQAMLGDDAEG